MEVTCELFLKDLEFLVGNALSTVKVYRSLKFGGVCLDCTGRNEEHSKLKQ